MDGRNPSQISTPERGTFKDGVGTFISDDVHDGKPIKVRSQWSRITPDVDALGTGMVRGRRHDLETN